ARARVAAPLPMRGSVAAGLANAVAVAVENDIRVGFFENFNRNLVVEKPRSHSRRIRPARRRAAHAPRAAEALLSRAGGEPRPTPRWASRRYPVFCSPAATPLTVRSMRRRI